MVELDNKHNVPADEVVDYIINLFHVMGDKSYLGEGISQAEHGLQCAVVADQFESSDSLIIATLLHDIGHFLHDFDEDCADHGIDSQHEDVGADWLSKYFPDNVTEPVRMHVGAKRYLCAKQPDYFDMLSPASVHSLKLQGGPMNEAEIITFEESLHLKDALDLRRYEEAGKSVGVKTPAIESYRALMEKLLKVG